MPPRSSSPRLAAIRSDGESVRRGPSLSCSGAPTLPWSHEATTLSSLAYVYSTTGFGMKRSYHFQVRKVASLLARPLRVEDAIEPFLGLPLRGRLPLLLRRRPSVL